MDALLVLVAYTTTSSRPDVVAASGRSRVRDHYALPVEDGRDLPTGVGVHVWRTPDPDCAWPEWIPGEPALVSAYPPLGLEEVTGHTDLDHAARALPRQLVDQPHRALELTPPFAAAAVDSRSGELHLWNDLLGVGRLFSLRTDDGWVFANRPAAAVLFAGVEPAAAPTAWLQLAGCEWAMGDRTAYRGVRAVPPGSHIVCRDGRRRDDRVDLAARLAERTLDFDDTVERAAAAMRSTAASVSRLWLRPPEVDLSGGRDSRVTAAAFLAAGTDAVLTTHESVPAGEAALARHLVSLLPAAPPHDVSVTLPQTHDARAVRLLDRVRRWHDATEATRPVTYLWHDPSDVGSHRLVVGGTAGEVAHAFYYPPEQVAVAWRELDEARRTEVLAEHLLWQIATRRGPTHRVHDAIRQQCLAVVAAAVAAGLADERAITFFYLTERLRRWSAAGERPGTIAPFLAPGVVLAAFGMTAQQRRTDALHVALLRRLQPQWADVPFFKPAATRPATSVDRIAATADHASVAAVISAEDSWRTRFRPPLVRQMWLNSRSGTASGRQERVLARILWRAGFDDHLARLGGRLGVPPGRSLSRSAAR